MMAVLECPVCLDPQTSMLLLPCLHSICIACIDDICQQAAKASTTTKCFFCQEEFLVDLLQINHANVSNVANIPKPQEDEYLMVVDSEKQICCEDHPLRIVGATCCDCYVLVCSDCQDQHVSHQMRNHLGIAPDELRAVAQELRVRAQKAIEELNMSLTSTAHLTVIREIDEFFEGSIASVQRRYNEINELRLHLLDATEPRWRPYDDLLHQLQAWRQSLITAAAVPGQVSNRNPPSSSIAPSSATIMNENEMVQCLSNWLKFLEMWHEHELQMAKTERKFPKEPSDDKGDSTDSQSKKKVRSAQWTRLFDDSEYHRTTLEGLAPPGFLLLREHQAKVLAGDDAGLYTIPKSKRQPISSQSSFLALVLSPFLFLRRALTTYRSRRVESLYKQQVPRALSIILDELSRRPKRTGYTVLDSIFRMIALVKTLTHRLRNVHLAHPLEPALEVLIEELTAMRAFVPFNMENISVSTMEFLRSASNFPERIVLSMLQHRDVGWLDGKPDATKGCYPLLEVLYENLLVHDERIKVLQLRQAELVKTAIAFGTLDAAQLKSVELQIEKLEGMIDAANAADQQADFLAASAGYFSPEHFHLFSTVLKRLLKLHQTIEAFKPQVRVQISFHKPQFPPEPFTQHPSKLASLCAVRQYNPLS